MSGEWILVKRMEQKGSDLLFYLDTEFAGDMLIEVGVENAIGQDIIHGSFVHNELRRQIYQEGAAADVKMYVSKQKKKSWLD